MTKQEIHEVNLAWSDIVIAGPQAKIEQLLAEIERTLPPHWYRKATAEQRAASLRVSLPRSRCYSRKLADREVLLWLLRVSDRRVQSGLVEPTDPARHLEDNAEAILDFRRSILGPAAKTSGLTISRNHLGPYSLVPGAVKESLWSFYDSSNFEWPPAGEALRRWREFVVISYQNHAAFNIDELRTWFVEKGWDEAGTKLLTEQLLTDAALLSEYEELRQPA